MIRIFQVPAVCFLLVHLVAECALPDLPSCSRTCEQGHYCSRNDCKPCEYGHYQSNGVHMFTYCFKWTTKPPLSHYVKVKEGTDRSDAEWRCQEGYVEEEYAVGNFACYKMPTTMPSTTSIAETTTISTSALDQITTTIIIHFQDDHGSINTVAIVLGVFATVFIVVVIVVIFLVWYQKRHNGHCPGVKRQDRVQQADRRTAGDDNTEAANHLMNEGIEDTYYNFFLEIVKQLDDNLARAFLYSLHDPSGRFHPETVIMVESSKTKDSYIYLSKSLVKWAIANKAIDGPIIQNALAFVGRPNLLKEIMEAECWGDVVSGWGDHVTNMNVPDGGDNTRDVTKMGRLDRQAKFRLFYNLATHLLVDASQEFLIWLPDHSNRFRAREYFKNLQKQNIDFNNAFARTLQEWWTRHPAHPMRDIVAVLKNMKRNDILQHEDFSFLFVDSVPDTSINTNMEVSDIEAPNTEQ